jgi:hypothetical protein
LEEDSLEEDPGVVSGLNEVTAVEVEEKSARMRGTSARRMKSTPRALAVGFRILAMSLNIM